jgi:alpha-tubulin suppressor-like RCC1 family protein
MLEKPKLMDVFSDKKVILVAAGGCHSLAVCSDCSMYGWGAGAQGETGLGEFVDTHIPKQCVSYHRPNKKNKNVTFAKQRKESF